MTGIAGFQERVGNTREVSLQAPYAQRVATAVNKLGPLMQS